MGGGHTTGGEDNPLDGIIDDGEPLIDFPDPPTQNPPPPPRGKPNLIPIEGGKGKDQSK